MAGKETIAVITNMNQPLGRFCGNALEVKEAVDILKGNGEPDVVEVCCVLGAYILKMAGLGDNIVSNMKLIQSKIDNGEGLNKFKELIQRQWGDSRVIDKPEMITTAKYKIPVESTESGYVSAIEAKNIGQAVVNIGGGRLKKEDEIDYTVGIEVLKKIGDKVEKGEPMLYVYANDEFKAKAQIAFLKNSYTIVSEKVEKIKEILDIIE